MYGHQDLHWKDSCLYLGSHATGYSITPDTKYPSTWRVRYPTAPSPTSSTLPAVATALAASPSPFWTADRATSPHLRPRPARLRRGRTRGHKVAQMVGSLVGGDRGRQ